MCFPDNTQRVEVRNAPGCQSHPGAVYSLRRYYLVAVTARGTGWDYHTEIAYGLPASAENYSALPIRVRAVGCNIAIPRSQLMGEKTDVTFCRKYYVGW